MHVVGNILRVQECLLGSAMLGQSCLSEGEGMEVFLLGTQGYIKLHFRHAFKQCLLLILPDDALLR